MSDPDNEPPELPDVVLLGGGYINLGGEVHELAKKAAEVAGMETKEFVVKSIEAIGLWFQQDPEGFFDKLAERLKGLKGDSHGV